MKRGHLCVAGAAAAHALAVMAVLVNGCGSADDVPGSGQTGSVASGSTVVSGSSGGASTVGSGGSVTGAGGAEVIGGGGGLSGSSGAAGGGGGSSGAGGSGVGGAGGASVGPTIATTPSQLLAVVQTCSKVVSAHKYATDDGGNATIDICALSGSVFWKADMDIDCDGRDVGDGKCPGNDCCYQPQTAFTNKSRQPLAASVTPYVVIPGDFKYAGLTGGTVVAVIYNNKVQYAVFGDTGPDNIIGEASYACAASLGINPDAGNGGTDSGVTYIAFVGSGTVPADIEDQGATKTLGEKLAAQLVQSN